MRRRLIGELTTLPCDGAGVRSFFLVIGKLIAGAI
jgi:hypothetical protein